LIREDRAELSMRVRFLVASGLSLALCLASSAHADEGAYGNLDFSRLTKSQEQFFWTRLKSLAVEEAVLTYCGQPDAFAEEAKQGIRACVTLEALNKADSFFKTELKAAQAELRARGASCHAKPEANRGWLGVEIKAVEKDAGGTGALVTGAVAESPAAAADLRAGDVITAVNGEAIVGPKELSSKIRSFAPGATVRLGVSRDGAGRTVSVKLAAMAFDPQGRAALDMPALMASSREDLKAVADEVTDMCQKCKTSIWAVFCR
jgi:hypothetical protein